MDNPTKVKKGQSITLSESEVGYILDGVAQDIELVMIVIGSSTSVQITTSNSNNPVIDNTYNTYTTSGDKVAISIDNGAEELRMKGTGTVIINW